MRHLALINDDSNENNAHIVDKDKITIDVLKHTFRAAAFGPRQFQWSGLVASPAVPRLVAKLSSLVDAHSAGRVKYPARGTFADVSTKTPQLEIKIN